jgi:DNA-binding PadR family transcriptional regulator
MLELAILGFLREAPMHGYELKQRLAMLTGHFRPVSDGALYPAIGRLDKQGLITKQREPCENGLEKIVLHLTKDGSDKLIGRLANPGTVDVSDRNRFFTMLAFLHLLPAAEQARVLQLRLDFLEGGKSFFSASGGAPVKLSGEKDPFRKGMLLIAKETSRVEKQWLKDMIAELKEAE